MTFFIAVFDKLNNILEQERAQWSLWIPVAIGIGIATYFQLPHEPALATLSMTAILLGIITWMVRRTNILYLIFAGSLFVTIGMGASTLRTLNLATPMLHNDLPVQYIEATLDQIEQMPAYQRFTVSGVCFRHSQQTGLPHTVRVSFRGKMLDGIVFLPGMRLRLKVKLLPPMEAVAPGAYEFRRRAYFESIGAVGYGLECPQIMAFSNTDTWQQQLDSTIKRFRHSITVNLRQQLGGLSGAIAAALVTGDRSQIPNVIRQNYADSGIAHILAISGLHLSIVAGVIFLFFRRGFCLLPKFALNYPTKKWAAAMALVFTFVYLIICAAPVSAQRAFLMTGLILIGVMTDRMALTMRNVALAATVILLMLPECLMSPSFQLSFAAVISLVAGYDAIREPMQRWKSQNQGTIKRLSIYLLGISLSTIFATLATTPYILYTFHRFTLHAIPANLLSIPLTSFIIMPGLVLMLVLMPFGLDSWLHMPLHLAINLMTASATHVAAWPGSVILVPAFSPVVLALITMGALILVLLKTRVRLWGCMLIIIGTGHALISPRPDLFISGDAKMLGMRTSDNRLWMPSLRGSKFAQDSWMKIIACNTIDKLPKHAEIIINENCELVNHVPNYHFQNRYIIYQNQHIITVTDKSTNSIIINQQLLRDQGGIIAWLKGNVPIIKTVRQPLENRPWTYRPGHFK